MNIENKNLYHNNRLIKEITPIECGNLCNIWVDGVSQKPKKPGMEDFIDISFKNTIQVRLRIKTKDDFITDNLYNLYKDAKGYYSRIKQKKVYFDETELRKVENKVKHSKED